MGLSEKTDGVTHWLPSMHRETRPPKTPSLHPSRTQNIIRFTSPDFVSAMNSR